MEGIGIILITISLEQGVDLLIVESEVMATGFALAPPLDFILTVIMPVGPATATVNLFIMRQVVW